MSASGFAHIKCCVSCLVCLGDFQFAVASDDNAEFWLSSDESPLNARLLVYVGQVRSLPQKHIHSACFHIPKTTDSDMSHKVKDMPL